MLVGVVAVVFVVGMMCCLCSQRQIFLYIRCHHPILQQSNDTAYQSSR